MVDSWHPLRPRRRVANAVVVYRVEATDGVFGRDQFALLGKRTAVGAAVVAVRNCWRSQARRAGQAICQARGPAAPGSHKP